MQIHNIDLHYHAGQERADEVSLREHLEHARFTGRKVLGMTDHLGLYLEPQQHARHYEASVRGLQHYRADMDALKPVFPDLTLYFAPEIGSRQKLKAIPEPVIEASDFFIGEAAFPSEDMRENTDALVSRLAELRNFSDATGREVFLAHPFRGAVNLRLIAHDTEPSVFTMIPRWNRDFSLEEISEFFMLNLELVAEAATRCRIPLEVNGGTQARIRSSNLPAPLQMLWKAFAELKERGVELVPGSDQHGFKTWLGRFGDAVPADCFHALKISAEEIHFLERVAGSSGL